MSERFVMVPDPRDPRKFIRGRVVGFKALKEDWNEYELEDGTRVRVKLVVQSISYALDPSTGEVIRSPSGEPVLNVKHSVVVAALFPEERLAVEGGEGGEQ